MISMDKGEVRGDRRRGDLESSDLEWLILSACCCHLCRMAAMLEFSDVDDGDGSSGGGEEGEGCFTFGGGGGGGMTFGSGSRLCSDG